MDRVLTKLLTKKVPYTTYASKSIHTDGTTRTKRYWYYTTAVSVSENKTEIERLPADEIERVVMNALNERLADMRWLADQISGQVRETTAVCILRTIEQRVVEDDMTNVDAQSQDFLSIIDRFRHPQRSVGCLAEPRGYHRT